VRSLVARACCPSFVTKTHALTVGSVESGAHSFHALQSPSRQPPWHGLWVGALLGGRVAAPWRLRLCPRALGRGGAVRPVHVVPMRARAGHGGALRCGRAARRRRSRRPLHRRPPERRPRACGPARRRSLLRLWLCRLYLKSMLLGLAQAASEDV